MVELVNVSKTYEVNNKALNNISISLPNKGLIAITGKSGSGKSTLLNIIGAIDSFDGTLKFQDMNLESFSKTQLEYYRSSVVSFVFQEFYLIDHLTVTENLEIILQLQNNNQNNDKRIKESLKKVDLEGFEHRKINTLSGGEKQRVSLARAILSESKFILSDEPTGNLDEENSDTVLSILKTISDEKLVVIVSHDVESVKKHCNRLITLRDGSIYSDEYLNDIKDSKEETSITIANKAKSLPKKTLVEMAIKNIFLKKIKLVTTIVLLTLSFFLIGMAMVYNTFNVNDIAINAFYTNSDRDIDIHKVSENHISSIDSNTIDELTSISDRFIFNKRVMNSYDLGTNPDPILIFTQKTTTSIYDSTYFTKIGFSTELSSNVLLFGTLPVNRGDVVISDYMASMILKYDDTQDFSIISELINSEIRSFGNSSNYIISGIYKTDYAENYEASLTGQTFNIQYINRMYNDYQTIYMSLDTYDNVFNLTGYMELYNNDKTENIRIGKPQTEVSGTLVGDLPTSSDQLVVSLSLLDKFTDSPTIAGELTGNTAEISNYIGSTITLQTALDNYQTFTISGIVDDFDLSPAFTLMFKEEVYERFDYANASLGKIQVYNVVLTGNRSIDTTLLKYFSNNDIKHDNSYSYQIYAAEDIHDKISPILLIMGLTFLIIGFLTLVNYIISTVNQKQREIGILLSIGVPTRNIKQLFLIHIMAVISISFLLTTILLVIATSIQNASLAIEWGLSIDIFLLRLSHIIILLTLIIAIAILTFAIILRRIIKMTPVKAIREFIL